MPYAGGRTLNTLQNLAALSPCQAIAAGLTTSTSTYWDGSKLEVILNGAPLRKAMRQLPKTMKDRIETLAAEALLATPGKEIVALHYCPNRPAGRSVWAFFLGFETEPENGWLFLRSTREASAADSALVNFMKAGLADSAP